MPDAVRAELERLGDPVRAAGAQAYMKSSMPFRGVRLPDVRAVVHGLLTEPFRDRAELEAVVRGLWDDAAYREERYAAIAVARHRRSLPWAEQSAVTPLYEHLVVSGAWWDYVDEIASHLVGPVLRASPDVEAVRMRRWAREESRWLRRAAVLSQLSSKAATDRRLLLDCIEPNAADRDVFVAKAVGWALRQYATVDDHAADWVRDVVRSHADLTPLARREALRTLDAAPGPGRRAGPRRPPAPPTTAPARR